LIAYAVGGKCGGRDINMFGDKVVLSLDYLESLLK